MNLFRSATVSPTPAAGPGAGAVTAAAADNPPRPSSKVVWLCYAFVAIGAGAAWLVNNKLDPTPPAVPEGITVLVLLYVLAQVIERALEPAVRLTVPDKAIKERDEKVAAAIKSPANEAAAKQAANAQKRVDEQRANVSAGVWAVASVMGMLLSAISGAYLLKALGVNGLDDKPWIDVLVTGTAIGAGTKPVHDLISRIDAAKNAAKDPPETR